MQIEDLPFVDPSLGYAAASHFTVTIWVPLDAYNEGMFLVK